MRNFGLFLINKPQHATWVALWLALLSTIGCPTGWLCALLIGFVTLCKGAKTGFWVLMWSALPAVALCCLGNPTLMINLVLIHCLSIWVFAVLLRRYHSWILIIEVGMALGMVIVAVPHLFINNLQQWWVAQLNQYWSQLVDTFHVQMTAAQVKDIALMVSPYATGLLVAFLLALNLLVLILARWWQMVIVKLAGLRKELTEIRMGHLISALLLLCILGIMFNRPLALDILPVITLPFVIAGLSLLHHFAADKKNRLALLGGVYTTMVLLTLYAAILIAFLGFIDSYYNFRRKKLLLKA